MKLCKACFVIRKHGMFATSQPTESGRGCSGTRAAREAEECTWPRDSSP